MAEKYEEFLETWFFRLQNQNPDLEKYLCVETLKFCCPNGYFGNDCSPCPGILKSGAACFGRGSCLVSSAKKFTSFRQTHFQFCTASITFLK